jgi:hypothetical protein
MQPIHDTISLQAADMVQCFLGTLKAFAFPVLGMSEQLCCRFLPVTSGLAMMSARGVVNFDAPSSIA